MSSPVDVGPYSPEIRRSSISIPDFFAMTEETDVKRARKFHSRSNAIEVCEDADLTGRTILITGTTAGIGTETARALALRGAHVVMANRNIVASEALKQKIIEEKSDAKIDLLMLDLSSLQSVQAAAKEYIEKHWPLHVLILNAGVFSPSEKKTIDGYGREFGVNHLAHWYLIRQLTPVLLQSAPSRIVIVASTSHSHTGINVNDSISAKCDRLCPPVDSTEMSYRLYAYSKMCNVLTAMKLHRDLNEKGVSVYVLHPGTMIGTDIGRGFGVLNKMFNVLSKPFTKSLSQGAATTVYCAANAEVANVSGKYWESCWDDEKSLQKNLAHDEALQEALWARTEAMIDKFEASRQPSSPTAPTA